ncbi:MAG: hypothetical protein K0V04_32070 [Deltaproteobacteria bacterium]|nr:hypothetical protein [Deltaproteobacteria bacterium]
MMLANAFRNDPKVRPRAQAKHRAVVEAGHVDTLLLGSRRSPRCGAVAEWCWCRDSNTKKGARALAQTLEGAGLGKPVARRLY